MPSCKGLAERYAAEENKPIPPSNASQEVKNNWLLIEEWGCIPPGTTEFITRDLCLPDPPTGPKIRPGMNDPDPPPPPASNLGSRPPVLNVYRESGFLAWVNERGLQCINRIVGNFYGLNTETGQANRPGPSTTPPDSQCWGACYNATTDSEMCFECIKTILTNDPSRCPAISATNPADENLIRDSISCHECIGSQAAFIQSQAQDAAPETPDLDAMTENVWRCVTGTVKPGLSETVIILIVVLVVFIAAVALTLGLYFGYFHPKILKSEARRLQLAQAGLKPDDF